jgi:putative acetyltransferase
MEAVGPRFRDASAGEEDALTSLERAASLRALSHIFPPERYPYPTHDVRDRWQHLLQDPSVRVGAAEDAHGLAAFVAFDAELLRHLAVRPDLWGNGLAKAALKWAVEHAPVHRLWCLEENSQALGFYERMGWIPTGRRQRAEFPPYPGEIELVSVEGP